MKGTTILTAYTKARVFTYESDSFDGDRIDRAVRQKAMFESALLSRLNAYDAAMDARVAERFMSQAMESAVTDFDFFAAVVNRINLDAVKIAALEASNTEQAQMLADGFADAKEQSTRLAEARDEVERLRPAAEAFRAWEEYDENPTTLTRNTFWTSAARAREARK